MKPIPLAEITVMIRIDFSDDAAWEAICSAIHEPSPEDQASCAKWAKLMTMFGQSVGELQANVDIVNDPQYTGITTDQLLELIPIDTNHTFIFVVDTVTFSRPDHPILVIDLIEERGRTFRTIPSELIGIESNLSLANCDWDDFANYVDEEGVYRGIPET